MNVVYREGTMSDCEAVYKLICELECKRFSYDRFSEIYENQLNTPHYYCLICEYQGSVIGVLNLRYEEQLHHSERIAEILEFIVDWSYRNIGIGKGMLAKAEELAKKAGCVQIEVACNQLRTQTHHFYSKENMESYHFKFSKPLEKNGVLGNAIGR